MLILVILLCVLLHFYTFFNIFVLYYSLSGPSVSFCLLMSVNYRFIPIFIVPDKFHKKYIKNHCSRRLPKPEGKPEGPHPLPRGQVARPRVGPRQEAACEEGTSPGAPSSYIYLLF